PLDTASNGERTKNKPTASANPTRYAARASSAALRTPSMAPTRIPVVESIARVSKPRKAPLTVGKVLRRPDPDAVSTGKPQKAKRGFAFRLSCLHALRLRLARRFAGPEPFDQIGNVRKLLLEIALVALQTFEHVVAVVPAAAEPAMVSSASVMHGHLPS